MAWRRLLLVLAFAALFGLALYLGGFGIEPGPPRVAVARAWALVAGASVGVLLGVLGLRAWRLFEALRRGSSGARLTARLLLWLLILAVLPLLPMYGFALRYVGGSIDRWFRPDVEAALRGALDVARGALDQRLLDAQAVLLWRVAQVGSEPPSEAELDGVLAALGALEVSAFDGDGRLIASASADPRFVLPRPLEPGVRQRLRSGPVAELEGSEQDLVLLVAVPTAGGWWQARLAPPAELVGRARLIETQFHDYRQLEYLRASLEFTITAVLTVALIAAILAAVYLAFAIATRAVAPITRLAGATRGLAAGDWSLRVAADGNDELADLARDFNHMAEALAEADRRVRQSAAQAEAERGYLQALVEQLSSGVLALDGSGVVRRANRAAGELLGVDAALLEGRTLRELLEDYAPLRPFFECLERRAERGSREWQDEVGIARMLGSTRLLLRAVRLAGAEGGWVVMFEDAAEYGRAQRERAWGEVARRLAHEIKNPLTPIQLAAERLRRRYLGSLPEAEREVLDRSTQTIVGQVETLKRMVDEFSEYARPSALSLQSMPLSQILREVQDLYAGAGQARFELDVPDPEPWVRIDPTRMRQLLVNLVKNAIEAVGDPTATVLHVRLRRIDGEAGGWLELCVDDNGPGIPAELRERLFEPYSTTKTKGTGLGLAIVKRIAEEHGGSIQAEDAPEGGARFRLRLPLG